MTTSYAAEHAAHLLVGGLPAERIHTHAAHCSRIYDYLLHGRDNYSVDREAAEDALVEFPRLPEVLAADRAFLGRAVRHLVREHGIDQLLDIGVSLPGVGDAAYSARGINPAVRIVAVDNDPIIVAHARARLTGTDPGATAVLHADLRDPETILCDADLHRVLDLSRPVGLLLVSVLHFLPDTDHPHRIVKHLMDGLCAGSFLALSHATADQEHDAATAAAQHYQTSQSPITLRPYRQIEGFLEDLDPVDPGLAQPPWWRPDSEPAEDPALNWGYAAVARKP